MYLSKVGKSLLLANYLIIFDKEVHKLQKLQKFFKTS